MIAFVLLEIEYIFWGIILIREIVQQGLCGTSQCMKSFVSDCAEQTVFMKRCDSVPLGLSKALICLLTISIHRANVVAEFH